MDGQQLPSAADIELEELAEAAASVDDEEEDLPVLLVGRAAVRAVFRLPDGDLDGRRFSCRLASVFECATVAERGCGFSGQTKCWSRRCRRTLRTAAWRSLSGASACTRRQDARKRTWRGSRARRTKKRCWCPIPRPSWASRRGNSGTVSSRGPPGGPSTA
eukprot:scaffold470_cov257-Pinguiococcus_pyrenoidosus.AAC.38